MFTVTVHNLTITSANSADPTADSNYTYVYWNELVTYLNQIDYDFVNAFTKFVVHPSRVIEGIMLSLFKREMFLQSIFHLASNDDKRQQLLDFMNSNMFDLIDLRN
jgi:hypothetical protein